MPDPDLAGRALRSFCRALLPPDAGGPDPEAVARRVESHLSSMPRTTRAALLAGFLAVSATGRFLARDRLDSITPRERADALDRICRIRPEAAAAIEGLKAIVLLAHGADSHAAEMIARSSSVPVARPDPVLDVTPSVEWPSTTACDAVVIGSGAGGAMVARTLARVGAEVVLVEEGRRWSVEELRSTHPLDRYRGLYRDGGTTVALGNPPVVLPIGRAVGGTTVVNSGTCFRPPEEVQIRWRDSHGLGCADPDALAPYLDEVEATLRVGAAPLDVIGRNGRLALTGAEILGWEAAPLRRNAPDCVGSCQCAIGCPRNAKYGVHLNALPQACEAGARIVSGARVERILHDEDRAVGVVARRSDGTALELHAPTVVVAAGATETPGLLVRSGLGGHPQLGRNLALHPALGVGGLFDEPVVAWEGVLQSVGVEALHRSHGILIEATSTPPGMGSMMLPGFGPELLGWLERADHLASVGAMIADEPSGRLEHRAGLIRYDLSRRDGKKLIVALSALGRLLFAAGATEVLTGVPGVAPVGGIDELDRVLEGLDARRLHLAAFHPTGTARAGADAQMSPVDADGRIRTADGVWVADASIVPSCPEVNPQVSIMALSLAVADRIVDAR